MESLWYLHFYGIYKVSTILLQDIYGIAMTSTAVYDNYGLSRNSQDLLM